MQFSAGDASEFAELQAQAFVKDVLGTHACRSSTCLRIWLSWALLVAVALVGLGNGDGALGHLVSKMPQAAVALAGLTVCALGHLVSETLINKINLQYPSASW